MSSTSFCLHCKDYTGDLDRYVESKGQRLLSKSECEDCGRKKSSFIGKGRKVDFSSTKTNSNVQKALEDLIKEDDPNIKYYSRGVSTDESSSESESE